MAGNKIFYVTRTETEGQPAGAATLHRGDKPQLLKIVGVDHAGNPDPATPEDNQIYATEEENQEILFTSDTVQDGDYNPVTSDAVFHYAKPPRPDWANAVAITAAQITAGYTAPSDGMIVGWTLPNDNSLTQVIVKINNTIVARSYRNNNSVEGWDANVQCPVAANDTVIVEGRDAAHLYLNMSFVPWK
jgi:hypothetical protein